MIDPRCIDDVATFAAAHVSSWDIDPVYPVLRWIEQRMFDNESDALNGTLIYCAYYNLASAVEVMRDGWTWDKLRLPTGVERRNLRGGINMARHRDSLNSLPYDSWADWLLATGSDWESIYRQAALPWGNGRWACYKLCELLQEVHGWRISAPDMGNEGSTGPVKGLEDLYGSLPTVAEQDAAAADLRTRLAATGVSLSWSQLETVLCDFHSMRNGHYYVGHDIDLMQEQLERAEVSEPIRRLIYEARREALPNEYLGELNGWIGVDRERRTRYQYWGEVEKR